MSSGAVLAGAFELTAARVLEAMTPGGSDCPGCGGRASRWGCEGSTAHGRCSWEDEASDSCEVGDEAAAADCLLTTADACGDLDYSDGLDVDCSDDFDDGADVGDDDY